jgi:hypothetical protein
VVAENGICEDEKIFKLEENRGVANPIASKTGGTGKVRNRRVDGQSIHVVAANSEIAPQLARRRPRRHAARDLWRTRVIDEFAVVMVRRAGGWEWLWLQV